MDNLLLDALRAHTGAQLAFSNGWRYSAVPPGPIARNNLFNIVPMDPPVATVTLTGEEVLAMLEENLGADICDGSVPADGGLREALPRAARLRETRESGRAAGSSSCSSARRRCNRHGVTARLLSPSKVSRNSMAEGARPIPSARWTC